MKAPHNALWSGLVFLSLSQIMVGVNIVFSKYILVSMPVLLILTIRFTFAALILFLLHGFLATQKTSWYQELRALTKKDWMFIFAQALCAGVLFNCLMLWGLESTDANVAGIITSALPALIAVMSWLILGETFAGKQAICVGLASLGLMIIAYDKLHGLQKNHSFLGDVIVLCSLLPEASYYVLSRMYTSPLSVFLISGLLNAINALLLLGVLCFYAWTPLTVDVSAWMILVVLGLSSGLFYVFWFIGCQKVDGVMASLTTAVMPVATVVIAWILLGEQLTLSQMLGMGLVLFSIGVYAMR